MSRKLLKLLQQVVDAPGIRPAHREKLKRAQKSILVVPAECRYCRNERAYCWHCAERRA